MADEWWSSPRTDKGASACSTAPDATEPPATGATSIYFQPSLHNVPAASPPSFLADPHIADWTQAYTGGRAAGEAATTGFSALLQLPGRGDAGRHHFLLDQPPPPATASQSALQYADNQYSSSSARSYGDTPAAVITRPLSQQQFSGFFGSSTGNFGLAPEPPPLLFQAGVEHKPFKCNTEGVQDACSSVTRSVPDSSAAAKKPRIETPSPLPTFKVRKEKLGDRITALQQLVSPFGKTDTASVLHEAIEYIKFLHGQVASLSSPYLRCGRLVHQLQQQKAKDGSEAKEGLRSRGLCLVPVAGTYSAASETAPEFWHPNFGGTFR